MDVAWRVSLESEVLIRIATFSVIEKVDLTGNSTSSLLLELESKAGIRVLGGLMGTSLSDDKTSDDARETPAVLVKAFGGTIALLNMSVLVVFPGTSSSEEEDRVELNWNLSRIDHVSFSSPL